VLERERRRWAGEAAVVSADEASGRGEPDERRGTKELDADRLLAALASADVEVLASAAWLAGRVFCEQPELDQEIQSRLEGLVGRLDPTDDYEAYAWLEGVVSLVLIGAPTDGVREVHRVLDRQNSGYRYLAAAYLAQLGDPSGWPVIQEVLGGDNEHTRLMAARQLGAFLPYDGQKVGRTRVEVLPTLARLTKDPSRFVRREAPGLLAESGGPAARGLIEEAGQTDDEELRGAVQAALDAIG
jgi:HEAT repeat protein